MMLPMRDFELVHELAMYAGTAASLLVIRRDGQTRPAHSIPFEEDRLWRSNKL